MPSPLRIAFLGCGFITRVHSRNLRRFRSEIVCGYASRDKAKADSLCGEYRGTGAYSDYADAINDPGTRAELYTRVFAGLFKTGLDDLVDFNCQSAKEEKLCGIGAAGKQFFKYDFRQFPRAASVVRNN
jgi:hypothetical protein